MGWIMVLAMAAIAFLALWRIGRVPRPTWELIGAGLLLGMAGYAWQGSPGLAGTPVVAKSAAVEVDPKLIEQRKAMMGSFGTEAQWLDTADTFGRLGSPRDAVTVMLGGVRAFPKSADMWVGLGNALVNHAEGMMTPAAQYAFQKAADLSPQHPGPPFFMGLALAQSGQFDRADAIWTALLARTPAEAPWRADLETRLGALRAQMGRPALPAAPPAAPKPSGGDESRSAS
jgi:cytochrome c-type biogenesis protein CcmH